MAFGVRLLTWQDYRLQDLKVQAFVTAGYQDSASFGSAEASEIHLVFSASAPGYIRPVAELGPVELIELGPTIFGWMHYPRLLVRGAQKLFMTAVIIPFSIVGIVWLTATRRMAAALLLIVPAYFIVVQSPLHTERRYVVAIHYFLVMLAAVALGVLFDSLRKIYSRGRHRNALIPRNA